MRSINRNIFKISGIYTSVILGAGFASGQELLNFFGKYGKYGFLGMIFTGIIFIVIGYKQLCFVHKYKIKNYTEFTLCLFGEEYYWAVDYIVIAFMVTLLSTMLSAGGATLNEVFKINGNIGVLILGVLCLCVMMKGLEGLVNISTYLAPFMVIGGIFIGFYTFIFQSVESVKILEDSKIFLWILPSISYISYNSISSIALLSNLGEYVENNKEAFWGSVLGGFSMTFLGLSLLIPINVFYDKIADMEIPMIGIVSQHNNIIKYLYLLILMAAIFTTAISAGFTIVNWVKNKWGINNHVSKIFVILTCMFLAQLGFSNFIKIIYPIFGVLGLVQVIKIFLI